MEMKIAIRVDAVQVLMITRCLQRQAAEARLAGPAVWPQGCGLPVVWPILLKCHPEVQAGRPLVLRVPARMGERPRGIPPADCDLTADEVLLVMQVLWKWDGPSPVCRLWNLVYAALSWGVAQELADQGHGIDLATIAGRMAFCRLMERQLRQHCCWQCSDGVAAASSTNTCCVTGQASVMAASLPPDGSFWRAGSCSLPNRTASLSIS